MLHSQEVVAQIVRIQSLTNGCDENVFGTFLRL